MALGNGNLTGFENLSGLACMSTLLPQVLDAPDSVLFIEASRDFEAGSNQNQLRPQDIENRLTICRDRKPVEKYAHLANRTEIAENDYNLNIPHYVDTFEEEEEIDIRAVQSEIEEIEAQLANVQNQLKTYLQSLGFHKI